MVHERSVRSVLAHDDLEREPAVSPRRDDSHPAAVADHFPCGYDRRDPAGRATLRVGALDARSAGDGRRSRADHERDVVGTCRSDGRGAHDVYVEAVVDRVEGDQASRPQHHRVPRGNLFAPPRLAGISLAFRPRVVRSPVDHDAGHRRMPGVVARHLVRQARIAGQVVPRPSIEPARRRVNDPPGVPLAQVLEQQIPRGFEHLSGRNQRAVPVGWRPPDLPGVVVAEREPRAHRAPREEVDLGRVAPDEQGVGRGRVLVDIATHVPVDRGVMTEGGARRLSERVGYEEHGQRNRGGAKQDPTPPACPFHRDHQDRRREQAERRQQLQEVVQREASARRDAECGAGQPEGTEDRHGSRRRAAGSPHHRKQQGAARAAPHREPAGQVADDFAGRQTSCIEERIRPAPEAQRFQLTRTDVPAHECRERKSEAGGQPDEPDKSGNGPHPQARQDDERQENRCGLVLVEGGDGGQDAGGAP